MFRSVIVLRRCRNSSVCFGNYYFGALSHDALHANNSGVIDHHPFGQPVAYYHEKRKGSPRKRKRRSATKPREKVDGSCVPHKNNSPNNRSTFDLFVSCLPGLEPLLLSELKDLGLVSQKASVVTGSGGVEVNVGSVHQLLQCHWWLGSASHVLWRCGPTFTARGLAELQRKVTKHFSSSSQESTRSWKNAISTKQLDIRVTASKSKLYHTGAIAERVSNGIKQALGLDTTVEHHDDNEANDDNTSTALPLVVRVYRDAVQISIDTAATPLHQRGYRLQTAKAPLREDLAFALLYAAGWGKRTSDPVTDKILHCLWDPLCGSGTIAIEGAAMMAGLPPGRLRPPPLVGTNLYNPKTWNAMVQRATQDQLGSNCIILASDRNAGAIKAATMNATRAGVSDLIHFADGAVGSPQSLLFPNTRQSKSPLALMIATNPPYGKRLSSAKKDLLPLYQTLGNQVRQQDVQVAAIMAQEPKLVRKMGLPVQVAFTTQHGGIPVSAMIYKEQQDV